MNKLPLDLQIQFFDVYIDEISVADFEKWLYSEKELEQLLDHEIYIELISLNFKGRHVKHEISKVIDSFLDFGKFEERKLRKLLTDLITPTDNFGKALMSTYDLYCSGYSFFNNLGLAHGLNFSNYYNWDLNVWESQTSEQKKNKIVEIHSGVQREAEIILNWLEEGKIVPTGTTNEVGHFDYIDKRSDFEKKLRTVETIEIEEKTSITSGTSNQTKRTTSNNTVLNKLWHWLTGS